jgi:hypothetical protein
MNQKNLDYLKENLKYLGFGDKLYPELEKNIQQGFPEFNLRQQNEYGKDKLQMELHFRRSDSSDMFFFNRYDAKLTNEKETLSQTFYVNKGSGFTVKEAYNLLNGRAVNKELTTSEGQNYTAWAQLDFTDKEANGNYKMKQFHQNYGFDVAASIAKLPIKELQNEQQREFLLRSLQRGNLQQVTLLINDKEQKVSIAANPQFKNVHAFDAEMKKLNLQTLAQGPSKEQATKVAQKEGAKVSEDESGDAPQATNKKSKRTRESLS